MKKVLLFNAPKIVKNIFFFQGFEIIEANKEDHNQQLGYLLKVDDYLRSELPCLKTIDEPMIVFYDLSEQDLDNALGLLKINNVSVELKAIVTDYNIKWPATLLYEELANEREAFKKKLS